MDVFHDILLKHAEREDVIVLVADILQCIAIDEKIVQDIASHECFSILMRDVLNATDMSRGLKVLAKLSLRIVELDSQIMAEFGAADLLLAVFAFEHDQDEDDRVVTLEYGFKIMEILATSEDPAVILPAAETFISGFQKMESLWTAKALFTAFTALRKLCHSSGNFGHSS